MIAAVSRGGGRGDRRGGGGRVAGVALVELGRNVQDRGGGGGRVADVALVEFGRNVNIASAAIAGVALLVGVEWLNELGPGGLQPGQLRG